MKVDNISANYNNIGFGTKMSEEKSFPNIVKIHVKKLYDRAEREVCEWGNFSDVVEKFEDPNGSEEYMLFITPSPNLQKPKERILNIGVQVPNTDRMFSMNIKRGEKKDILEFLANEENLRDIIGPAEILCERVND